MFGYDSLIFLLVWLLIDVCPGGGGGGGGGAPMFGGGGGGGW